MPYRRILTIQDISCVGQCSMTVALPILSACGHETCILPAAVLSTHTGGFGKPAMTNLTSGMDAIWRHWHRQGITFDAIYTGYLGSIESVRIVSELTKVLLAPEGILIVDPAMADHGKLYSGLDAAYANAMRSLCLRADVMLPNITEAAMMTGMPYSDSPDEAYVLNLLERLGGKDVVLTGVGIAPDQTGAAIRRNGKITFYSHEKIGASYSGTGDIFASAFTGSYLQEKTMEQAVQIASDYTCQCIRNTFESPAHWYGVKFETALPYLIDLLK